MTPSLPDDVQHLSWAAEQLGIGTSTAYRLVAVGKIPGAFRVGARVACIGPAFPRRGAWRGGGQRLPLTAEAG